jgi:hypothetical protein
MDGEVHDNGHCIGLTHRDGVTMNGEPDEFFVVFKGGVGFQEYCKAAATRRFCRSLRF